MAAHTRARSNSLYCAFLTLLTCLPKILSAPGLIHANLATAAPLLAISRDAIPGPTSVSNSEIVLWEERMVDAQDDAILLVERQGNYYAFSGAVYIITTGGTATTYYAGTNTLTPAQQVQCPAGYPQRCDGIGQPNYCCPSNNYCAYDSRSAVACCPNGQSCSGAIGGQSTYYTPSTTVWQPTTTVYQQATTTVYTGGGGGGVIVPAGYTTQGGQTTVYVQQTSQHYYGQYCSTLIEVGPGLPTTAAGACGIILIAEPSGAAVLVMGWLRLIMLVGGLQALGWLIFGVGRLR